MTAERRASALRWAKAWVRVRRFDTRPPEHSWGPRLSREAYALRLAETAALRAACTRRQVGAAILDDDGRVVALGYNGTPAGTVHCSDGGCPRGRYSHAEIGANLGNAGHGVPCIGLHAEANAAEWALRHGVDPATSIVAVCVPTGPCPECEATLREQGWGTVLWPEGGWTMETLTVPVEDTESPEGKARISAWLDGRVIARTERSDVEGGTMTITAEARRA